MVEAGSDYARRLLHQLVAATNRRLHKGFPSVYAYLLGKPNHYASHKFVKLAFTSKHRLWLHTLRLTITAQRFVIIGDMTGQHLRSTLVHIASPRVVKMLELAGSSLTSIIHRINAFASPGEGASVFRAMRATNRECDALGSRANSD